MTAVKLILNAAVLFLVSVLQGTHSQPLRGDCDLPGRFLCDGKCVQAALVRCDGVLDCSDGSDETGCPKCSPHQFDCGQNQCIDRTWLCNGIVDCKTARDESICNSNGTTSTVSSSPVDPHLISMNDGIIFGGLIITSAIGCVWLAALTKLVCSLRKKIKELTKMLYELMDPKTRLPRVSTELTLDGSNERDTAQLLAQDLTNNHLTHNK